MNDGVNERKFNELVIIDSNIADVGTILSSLAENQYALLLSDGTGMDELLSFLARSGNNWSAMHFITHGSDASFSLNGETISSSNLDLSKWAELGSYLAEGGDILLYGCNITSSDAGKSFIYQLATATGADVAASDDITGLGGDWNLESSTGAVEAKNIAFSNYKSVLYSGRLVINSGSLKEISNDTFSANTFSGEGGAVFNSGTFCATKSVFSNNSAGKSGGAITNRGPLIHVESCVFSKNSGSQWGGAIDNTSNAKFLQIEFSTFTENSAINGGAICNYGSTCTTIDSVFSGNSASYGGAVYNANNTGSSLTLRNCYFLTKTDTIYIESGNVTFGGTISLAGNLYSANAINVEQDTTIVFDLRSYEASNTVAIITNLDSILSSSKSISYQVEVSKKQEQTDRKYLLATGASARTISVKTESGILIETMTVGETKSAGDFIFNYTLENSALYFSVKSVPRSLSDLKTKVDSHVLGGTITLDCYYAYDETKDTVFSGITIDKTKTIFCDGYSVDALQKKNLFTVNPAVNFTLSLGTLSNAIAENGASVYNSGVLSLTDSTFSGNVAEKLGGAIYSESVVTVERTTFSGNNAIKGGAIYQTCDGTITIRDSYFLTKTDTVCLTDGNATIGGTISLAGNLSGSKGITVEDGTTLVFDFRDYDTDNAVEIITSMDTLLNPSADVTYQVEILKKQAGGKYLLATGASARTISIKTDEETLVNAMTVGETKKINGFIFNYALENNSLYLKVERNPSLTIFKNEIDTIASGETLTLNCRYTYDAVEDKSFSGITIDKNKTLFGNGHFIDASMMKKLFTVNSGATFAMESAILAKASADNGAAIYNDGVCFINGSTFNGNCSKSLGGALYTSGTTSVENSVFEANTVKGASSEGNARGGAIEVSSSGSLKLTNSTFSNNVAKDGGAIYNWNGKINATGCSFVANTASTYGGALYCDDDKFTISDCTFSGNTAKNGGAIYLGGANPPHSTVTIKNSSFLTQSDTIYSLNGTLTFGGTISLAGNLYSANAINVEQDTTIVFDLRSYEASNTVAIITNLDSILSSSKSISYQVEVSKEQTDGKYLLATGASARTISVKTESGILIETMTVGETKYVGGYKYSYSLEGNSLYFSVKEQPYSLTYMKYQIDSIVVGGTLTLDSNYAYDDDDDSTFAGITIDTSKTLNGANYTVNASFKKNLFTVNSEVNFVLDTATLSNAVAENGGAVCSSGTFTANSNTFSGNFASSNGGAVYNFNTYENAFLNVTGNTFSGNTADETGGAVCSHGTLTAIGNTFIKNASTYGGAINNSGPFVATSNSFSENKANHGGAIYSDDGIFTATSNAFIGNTASGSNYSGNGGAVYNGGKFIADNNTFCGNFALNDNYESYGGGVYNSGYFIASSNSFTQNTASCGGAVCNNYDNFIADRNIFSENTANYGGAIHNRQGGTVSATNNKFSGNTASFGGAVYNTENFSAANNIFSRNVAISDGFDVYGGAVCNQGFFLATGNTFSENIASCIDPDYSCSGGAVHNDGSFVATSNTFRGNTARSGGAVFNCGSGTYTDNIFSENTARRGGAVCVVDSELVVTTGNTFSTNIASYGGGAIYTSYGTVTATDNIFSGNTATDHGGAICNNGGVLTISNNTFSGNTASVGGAIYQTEEGGTITIRDSYFLTETDTIYIAEGDVIFGGTVSLAGNLRSLSATTVENDTTFVFDLRTYEYLNTTEIISNLDAVLGTEVNTYLQVQISKSQNVGRYLLATGSTNKTVSVKTADGILIPSISVGETQNINGRTYELSLEEEKLYFNISASKSILSVVVPAGCTQTFLTDIYNVKKIELKKEAVVTAEKIYMLAGNASITMENNSLLSAAEILPDDGGSKITVTLKNDVSMAVRNDMLSIESFSAEKNAVVHINGEYTGATEKSKLTLGICSTMTVAKGISSVNKLTLGNGTAANAKKGLPEQHSILEANEIEGTSFGDTLTFGNYAEVRITKDIVLDDGGSDTVKIGNYSKFNANDVKFSAATKSKNTFSLGTASTATVNNMLNVYKLTASNGIYDKKTSITSYTELTVATITGSTNADSLSFGNYSDVNLTGDIDLSAGGSDTVKIGNYSNFNANDIKFSGDTKNKNTFSLGTASTATVNDVLNVNKLTLSNGVYDKKTYMTSYTKMYVATITGSTFADTLTFGNYNDVDLSGDVDLSAGGSDTLKIGNYSEFNSKDIKFSDDAKSKNTFNLGTASTATVGNILNVNKVTLSNGVYNKKTGLTNYTALFASTIMGSTFGDTLTFGNDSSVNIKGSVTLGDGNDTLKTGNNAVFNANTVDFGVGNDTLSIGKVSHVNIAGINFGDGDAKSKDAMTIGSLSTVTVETAITGINKITISNGTAANAKKGLEAAYTELTTDNINGTDNSDTLSFGNYTKVITGDIDFGEGNDTLKLGSNTSVEIQGILDFGDGAKDALTIGKGSTVSVAELDVESLDKLTMDKDSKLAIGDDDDLAAAKEKWAKYSSQIVSKLS